MFTVAMPRGEGALPDQFPPFYVGTGGPLPRTADEKALRLIVWSLQCARAGIPRLEGRLYVREGAARHSDGFVDKMLRCTAMCPWRGGGDGRADTKMRTRWYKYGIVTYKHKIFMRRRLLIWKMVWFYRKTLHNTSSTSHPLPTELRRLCRRIP